MTNHYEIIGLDEKIGQLSVKFWTDEFTDGLIYQIDLPIDANNQVPNGQALVDLINSFFPAGQIQYIVDRRNAIAKVDLSAVKALVPPPPIAIQPKTIGTTTI